MGCKDPHFYKRGSLIVQYVGEDEKIISDLGDLLGEQFAGYGAEGVGVDFVEAVSSKDVNEYYAYSILDNIPIWA